LTRRPYAFGFAALVLGVAVACTTTRELEPAPPRRTPLGLPPAAAAEAPLGSEPTDGGLVEEAFSPWLTRPGFERVADAVDAADAPRAAAELEARLKAAPPRPADAPSLSLLAGLLHERAGEAALALAAFERAKGASGFALTGYAAAGRARALLALGRAAEGLTEARALPDEPSLAVQRRDLLVDAAFAAGERAAALDALRAQIKQPLDAAERWSREVRLARELLTPPTEVDGGTTPVSSDELHEALALARRVEAEGAGNAELAKKAADLVARALSLLPPSERTAAQKPDVPEELVGVEALIDARRYEDGLAAAEALARRVVGDPRSDGVLCRLGIATGKAYSGRRDKKAALDAVTAVFEHCKGDPERHARALFNAGKYAASDARYSDAVRYYGRVEAEHPTSTLADDARLQAALAYLELGVEARFTDLLRTLPDEYPHGDMAIEGLFRLAVRRIDKGDWSSADSVLTRAVKLVGSFEADAARGSELAGRERYFEARAALALGQRAVALDTFERILRELPLSYYMLHAFGRLHELDAPRAERALAEALEHARTDTRPRPPEHLGRDPGFLRSLELFKVGEITPAVAELDALGLTRPGAGPELLWTVARTYARAGAERLAHDVARRRLTDWLLRWPAGDWADAWRIAFPEPYQRVVEGAAKRAGVPNALVYAIMREESAFDPDAESNADALGLMQLVVPTARLAAKGTTLPHDRRALKRPSVNVELGCRMLAKFSAAFPDNPLLAIPAYNAGPNRVRDWLRDRPSTDFDVWVELIPFLETRRYVKRVLASRAAYAFLDDPAHGATSLLLPKKVEN
jgi:soluble lytic murein transglycosylase